MLSLSPGGKQILVLIIVACSVVLLLIPAGTVRATSVFPRNLLTLNIHYQQSLRSFPAAKYAIIILKLSISTLLLSAICGKHTHQPQALMCPRSVCPDSYKSELSLRVQQ